MPFMNLVVAKKAFIQSIPVFAGYIVLGMGFGIFMNDAGFGVLWTFAMSTFIYAGSMQYVGIGLLTGGASVITTIVTTIMVNARHLFYSISMLGRYNKSGKYKPYLIFSLTDETYSLLCNDNSEDKLLFFLVSLFNHFYWITGSVLGCLLGDFLPFATKGIEFSMTALFVASFTQQWISAETHIPAVAGVAGTLACLLIFGSEHFLIPSMIVIILTLTLLRSRLEVDQ